MILLSLWPLFVVLVLVAVASAIIAVLKIPQNRPLQQIHDDAEDLGNDGTSAARFLRHRA
jgi:hypothetical protein